jgi:nucleotide-binding universal stress UspA family protein
MPTDFSRHAANACDIAFTLAAERQAKVILLHVAMPLPIVLPEATITDVNLPAYLDKLRDDLLKIKPANPEVRVEHRVEQGDPAIEILRVAAKEKADLIVMGTHGRGGVLRMLMGSVAEQVMRKAPCPVMVVRLPAGKANPAAPEKPMAGACV